VFMVLSPDEQVLIPLKTDGCLTSHK